MLVASSADMRPRKVFTFLSTLCPFGPGTAWIQTSTTPFAAFASTFGRACSSQRASRGGGVDLDDCEDRVHGCSFKKCCGCMRYSLRLGLISVNEFFRKNTKYFCVAKLQHAQPSWLSRKHNQKKAARHYFWQLSSIKRSSSTLARASNGFAFPRSPLIII